MSETFSKSIGYLGRIVRSDSVKKGVAAAAAGFLIGAITEAIWPSS